MSAKTYTATPPRAAGPKESVSTPLNFLADLGRQQLSVAADASCAMLRGLEAMRKIHEQAAHDTSVRHEAVAQKLHGACEPADLMAAQAVLLRDDLEMATQYWQQLAATALEMHTEMWGCATHLVDSETALETASSVDAFEKVPGVKSLFPAKPGGAVQRPRRR